MPRLSQIELDDNGTAFSAIKGLNDIKHGVETIAYDAPCMSCAGFKYLQYEAQLLAPSLLAKRPALTCSVYCDE